jgi:hypothetical protein
MGMVSLLRRVTIGLCGTLLGLALMTVVCRSDEVSAHADDATIGFIIHDAAETARDYCVSADGATWFQLLGGPRFELVTSTCEMPNPGDGAFHPFDADLVRGALGEVRYPLGGVAVEVFVLPYPRRDEPQSAAGPGLILLSPGVVPISQEQQHATVVHELGHVIQYRFMPDDDPVWTRYRELRGLTDEQRYTATASHADRPHEIFAEDFRALFGDPLATYSGTIENTSLSDPHAVAGLAAFLTSLSNPLAAGVDLRGYPNPTRGGVSFRRSNGPAEPIDLFDASGRRVTTLDPTPLAEGWQWAWNGRDASGSPVPAGVLFARERGGKAAVRFVVVR